MGRPSSWKAVGTGSHRSGRAPVATAQTAVATRVSRVGSSSATTYQPSPARHLSTWLSSARTPSSPASAALTVIAALAGPAPEIKRRTSTSEIGSGSAPLRTWTPFTNELWVDSTTSVPAPQLTRIASAQNMTSDLERTSAACYRNCGAINSRWAECAVAGVADEQASSLVMTSAAGLRYTQ